MSAMAGCAGAAAGRVPVHGCACGHDLPSAPARRIGRDRRPRPQRSMTACLADLRPLVLVSGLPTGGAERVTVAFACRLWATGLRVAVCTVTARHDGPLAAELARAGVPRYDLGARRLADPRAAL